MLEASSHGLGLYEPVELRKKERASLLLLRKPVLRAAATTSPRARLRRARCTVLAVVIGHERGMDFREVNELTRSTSPQDHPGAPVT